MLNNKIVVSTRKMNDAIFAVFDQMIDEDSEIVAIYIGEEGKKPMLKKLRKSLRKNILRLKLKSMMENNLSIHISSQLNKI